MAVSLKVFIEPRCEPCERAMGLVGEIRERFPELEVEVVDVSREGVGRPDYVFAVPTFVLNDEVLSLGNPRSSRLVSAVEAALKKGKTSDGR